MLDPEYLLTALAGAASVGLILLIVQLLPAGFTRPILPPDQAGPLQARTAALDGLRGFLALGVVFQHAWIFRDHYFTHQAWARPHNPFFALAGDFAVSLFFMITGYLFWNKAIAARGRLKPVPFYLGRARRILPLYYFFCGLVLLIILLGGAAARQAPGTQPFREILSLAIPGRRPSGLLLGTERLFLMSHGWTLYYEVYFYLFFPVLALAARTRFIARAFVLLGVGLLIADRRVAGSFAYPLMSFLAGIGSAELLVLAPGARAALCSPVTGLLVLLVVPSLPALGGGGLTALVFGCGAAGFAAIAAGNDLLGLLSLKCARLAGQVSYSVYLLHLPLLYAGLTGLNHFVPIARLAPLAYAGVVAAAALLIVGISMLTYRFIERPWLHPPAANPPGLAMPAPKTG